MTIRILIVTFLTTLFIQDGACQGLLPALFPHPPGSGLLQNIIQLVQNLLRGLFGGLLGQGGLTPPSPFSFLFPPLLFPGLSGFPFAFPFAFLQTELAEIVTTMLRIFEQLLTGSPSQEGIFQQTIESILPKPPEIEEPEIPELPPLFNFLSLLNPANNDDLPPLPPFLTNLFNFLHPPAHEAENPEPSIHPILGTITALPAYFHRNCHSHSPLPLQLPLFPQSTL